MWIFVLGSTLNDGDLVIPYGQLIISLVALIGPISLGMWIRYRFEKGAKIMKAVIVPFTLLTVLFIFTVRRGMKNRQRRRLKLFFCRLASISICSYSCSLLERRWQQDF